MQTQINRITDILWKDDWISWSMDYTAQISWILFLKFLDDYEKTQQLQASLNSQEYKTILESNFRRENWAAPKKDWKLDILNLLSWDDLKDFVNKHLFPYLQSFRSQENDYHSIRYKIWEIFSNIDNKIEDWHTLREVIDIVDWLSFQKQSDIFEMSKIYESILFNLWTWGWTSGEFYTPRAVIKAIVECVDPKIWQTIYDPAAWSCGFLIESFEYLKTKTRNIDELNFLNQKTLWGNEKTPIAYIMWVMNMILHWIENPNLNKKNTLTDDIRSFEEKDRYDIILANPPFGWKEKDAIQSNFPIKTTATEMLFMQHFMKKLKIGWKAAIIVPEWVLFNNSNSFQEVKKQLLENFNVHSIVSLPAWVFLPYSPVKTNILFFEKTKPTEKIWYYEINLDRKLTKNKPINFEDLQDMIKNFWEKKISENSWIINILDIKNYDLSAKNPNSIKDIIHISRQQILKNINEINENIISGTKNLEKILK